MCYLAADRQLVALEMIVYKYVYCNGKNGLSAFHMLVPSSQKLGMDATDPRSMQGLDLGPMNDPDVR